MMTIVKDRMLQLLIVLFLLSTLTFTLMKIAPGDPVLTILKADEMAVTQVEEAALRQELGLNKPMYEQYIQWLLKLLRMDFGQSLIDNKPIWEKIIERLPATLMLAAGGMFVMLIFTFPIGILAAKYAGRLIDRLSGILAMLGASVPAYWLGLLLIYGFSYKLGWLPTMGMGSLAHLILPSLTLGFGMAAIYARLLRAGLLEVLSQDFIRSARSRGIGEWRLIGKHALRCALVPLLTVFGTSAASILAGSVIIEILFSWPGLGSMAIEAIFKRDYPVIQAYVMLSGIVIVFVNLLIDIGYCWVDPRIRNMKKGEG